MFSCKGDPLKCDPTELKSSMNGHSFYAKTSVAPYQAVAKVRTSKVCVCCVCAVSVRWRMESARRKKETISISTEPPSSIFHLDRVQKPSAVGGEGKRNEKRIRAARGNSHSEHADDF